jgi:hypothetical protein
MAISGGLTYSNVAVVHFRGLISASGGLSTLAISGDGTSVASFRCLSSVSSSASASDGLSTLAISGDGKIFKYS